MKSRAFNPDNKHVRNRFNRCRRCKKIHAKGQARGPKELCQDCTPKHQAAATKRKRATRQLLRLDGPANVSQPRLGVFSVITATGEIVQRLGRLNRYTFDAEGNRKRKRTKWIAPAARDRARVSVLMKHAWFRREIMDEALRNGTSFAQELGNYQRAHS